MILIVHTLFSTIALLSGVIFLIPKGTANHKKIGYLYVFSMIVSLITSFGLFNLWNRFGVYHALSLVSFMTLAIALYFPILGRGRKKWAEHHLLWMGYSYIGLVMAAGSHLFSVFQEWPSWLRIGLFWVLPYALGTIIIVQKKVTTAKKALQNINK